MRVEGTATLGDHPRSRVDGREAVDAREDVAEAAAVRVAPPEAFWREDVVLGEDFLHALADVRLVGPVPATRVRSPAA